MDLSIRPLYALATVALLLLCTDSPAAAQQWQVSLPKDSLSKGDSMDLAGSRHYDYFSIRTLTDIALRNAAARPAERSPYRTQRMSPAVPEGVIPAIRRRTPDEILYDRDRTRR